MATLSDDLIDRARKLLNDPDGVLHTDECLRSYLNEGLCQVYAARPTEFTETITVTLKPGARQTLPVGCVFVEAADNPASGSQVSSTVDQNMLRRFTRTACADRCHDGTSFEITSVTGSAVNRRDFYVEPPVPAGTHAVLDVTVLKAPDPVVKGEDMPVDCGFDPALVDWIMHRAYSKQIESAYAVAQAQVHAQDFWAALGVGYDAAGRIASGYNLGFTGHDTAEAVVGTNRDLRGVRR